MIRFFGPISPQLERQMATSPDDKGTRVALRSAERRVPGRIQLVLLDVGEQGPGALELREKRVCEVWIARVSERRVVVAGDGPEGEVLGRMTGGSREELEVERPTLGAAGITSSLKASTNGAHDFASKTNRCRTTVAPGCTESGRDGGIGEKDRDSIILSVQPVLQLSAGM
jgi:hypothetical protein